MLRRIRIDIRNMGVLGWILYSSDRVLDRFSLGRMRLWAFRFYAQPIPEHSMLPVSHRGRISIGRVMPGEIDSRLFERPAGAIEERFQAGSICVAAQREEELAGFMWLHFGALKERLVECDFEPTPAGRTCWDYDLEVFPHYRLGRTFARLWDETNRLLRNRGVEASVSWISFWNLTSRRAHMRMGAQPIGWMGMLDLFGWKVALQSRWPFLRLARPGRRLHVVVNATKAITPRRVASSAATSANHSIARNHTPEP